MTRAGAAPRARSAAARPVAVLWYAGALFWRLRRGTAGVKPIEDLMD